jgi:hypothetical protein
MENAKKKKPILFKVIETKEEALKTIKDASYAFLFVAVLTGAASFILGAALVIDAVLYLVLALLLFWLKSRTIAVLLLVFSCMSLIVTVLNRMGMMNEGGGNIFLAIIIVWISIKAVEATFKLHGKFKETP